MLKVIDNIFSLNSKNSSNDLKVNTDFIYNYYEKNETTINDDVIAISDFSYYKKRFIRLSLENHNENDKKDYNRDNFIENIENLSKTNSLKGEYLEFFNKLDTLSPKRKYVINRLDNDEEKLKISSFYNKDKLSIIPDRVTYSYRMSYLRPEDFDVNINQLNSISDFPEPDLVDYDQNYDNLIFSLNQKEEDLEEIKNSTQGNIFNKCKPFEKSVNEISGSRLLSKINGIRCGLLIEKYILNGNKYNFLCAKFITSNKNNDELHLKSSYEDEAVRYGQTYRYVVYNVYLYSELDNIDKCILNKYLICDHPYITKDILCKEEEAPPPPDNLRFRMTKNKKIFIEWDEPTDYQYDAKGYQILKRNNLEEPFRVIAQLEGHSDDDLYEPEEETEESLIIRTPNKVSYEYTDYLYEQGKICIYAIRTIDAHGYFSNYSQQVAVGYDPFEDKIIYDLVCSIGARRNMPNEFMLNKSKFFDNEDKMIDNLPISKNIKNIKLYVTPDFGEISLGDNSKIDVITNDDKFKFTIFRLNDLEKYEKQFVIKNFINN
jgi:hypothetical protein